MPADSAIPAAARLAPTYCASYNHLYWTSVVVVGTFQTVSVLDVFLKSLEWEINK